MRLAHLLSAEVLEEKRHARERAVRDGTRRVSESALELAMDHGVDLGIEPLDAGDRRLDELDAAATSPRRTSSAKPGRVVLVEELLHGAQFGIRPPLTMIV